MGMYSLRLLVFVLVSILAGCGKKSDDILAGWELIEKNQSWSVYAEKNSRRPMEYSRGKVVMNVLFDHKNKMFATNSNVKNFEYLSALDRIEYDCDESAQRTWFISYHEAALGQGSWDFFDLKRTADPSAAWIPIPADLNSVNYRLKAYACEERARD